MRMSPLQSLWSNMGLILEVVDYSRRGPASPNALFRSQEQAKTPRELVAELCIKAVEIILTPGRF
jgi:hypothetical protein